MVMCVGALIGLAASLTWYGEPTLGICHSRVWLLSIAFQLFFGPFLLKTFRLRRIFNKRILLQLRISDKGLASMLLGLVAVEVGLLLLYSLVGAPYVERTDGMLTFHLSFAF
jgi:hypothetical protein